MSFTLDELTKYLSGVATSVSKSDDDLKAFITNGCLNLEQRRARRANPEYWQIFYDAQMESTATSNL